MRKNGKEILQRLRKIKKKSLEELLEWIYMEGFFHDTDIGHADKILDIALTQIQQDLKDYQALKKRVDEEGGIKMVELNLKDLIESLKKLEIGLMMTPSKTGDEEDILINYADIIRQAISIIQDYQALEERVDEEKIKIIILNNCIYPDPKNHDEFEIDVNKLARALVSYLRGERKG